MGAGSWDASTYNSTVGAASRSGTSFGYSTATTTTVPRAAWTAHAALDPVKLVNQNGPFAGKNVRESRDNADHPLSLPIVIGFDDTGSMGRVPKVLVGKLAEVFGLLLRKGYATDPQIAVAAYGDSYCDTVPLQFSQFESDNRIDENLNNLLLEGGGGGNGGETATSVVLFTALKTATDSWEKRQHKGYLITIGDEIALPLVKDATKATRSRSYWGGNAIEDQISNVLGDDHELTETQEVTYEQAVRMAEKAGWNVFHLLINNMTAEMQGSERFYRKVLGDNLIVLEDENAAAETIAGLIGIGEGTIDLDDFAADLDDVGGDARSKRAATSALVKFNSANAGKGGAIVRAETPDDLVAAGPGTNRL